MTSKPVNLRQFRKRKAREDKAKEAEVNRVAHGTPKAVRDLSQAQCDKLAREIDGKKRDRPDGDDSNAPE